jgi:hypothetical protein
VGALIFAAGLTAFFLPVPTTVPNPNYDNCIARNFQGCPQTVGGSAYPYGSDGALIAIIGSVAVVIGVRMRTGQ